MRIGHGPPSQRQDLFGGHGEVLVWDLLSGQSAPPFTSVLSCVLAAGGHVGRHVQQRDSEIVIGLTGCGEATVDGRVLPFGPGSVVFLPFRSSLELRNERTDAPLRYLIVKATPAGESPPASQEV
ncbi:cupin domain-containing protein [Nannocystis radixulma]|uniref:Cupin domain-containing protein n=1 Tax=Nannocystis radixulma TaxID=2995305 RepID=A0ABT5BKF7_9BACT|nr:cupin domain-containing protein [Nannocystis radixulma]MDC0673431.1 cupin domain-containing protein [Nannocystis radixulma]